MASLRFLGGKNNQKQQTMIENRNRDRLHAVYFYIVFSILILFYVKSKS
jgi:hypothetical protein